MKISIEIFLWSLMILGYVMAPVTIIWGWVRWARELKLRTVVPFLSLAGLVFASASALLAIGSRLYAQPIGGFSFYDSLLLRIYRWGAMLSLAAFLLSLGGIWRKLIAMARSTRWNWDVGLLVGGG